MAALLLCVWSCWPAILVLQFVEGSAVGNFCTVLLLHLGMDSRAALTLVALAFASQNIVSDVINVTFS